VAGDQIELGVGRGELMLGAAVAKVQPGPASLIACLDVVNAVRHLCGVGQGAQPLAIGRRVGRKVQHHAGARPEHVGNQRPHHRPHLAGKAHVVGHRVDLLRVQPGEPVILAQQDRRVFGCQGLGQCRLAGGDLAAHQMKRRGGHGVVLIDEPP